MLDVQTLRCLYWNEMKVITRRLYVCSCCKAFMYFLVSRKFEEDE